MKSLDYNNYNNVAYCFGRNYFKFFLVSLVSLCENNNTKKYYLWVIHDGISEQETSILKNICTKYSLKYTQIKISADTIIELPLRANVTLATYYRLSLPILLPKELNRVLYIDADTVISNSLNELFNLDLSGKALAAVEDALLNRQKALKMKPEAKYFNSGVMLINLHYWHKHEINKKVLNYIKSNPDQVLFLDQCGLNKIIDGNFINLHPRYNQLHIFFHKVDCSDFCLTKYGNMLEEALNQPVIIHFTGFNKPWILLNNHPYKKVYWKYLRKTPYKFSIPEITVSVTLKNLFLYIVPLHCAKRLRKLVRI